MTKATHDGECQVCGSVQRLPGGVLAKHGYTTRWGCFSGTCWGSDSLPFEQSKNLIDGSIARAQLQIADTEALARELRARRDGTTWVHEYVPATWQFRYSSYKWVEIELLLTPSASGYPFFSYTTSEGKLKRLDVSGYPKTLEAARVILNERRASAYDDDVKKLHSYITFQQERVKDWTVKSLRPRTK